MAARVLTFDEVLGLCYKPLSDYIWLEVNEEYSHPALYHLQVFPAERNDIGEWSVYFSIPLDFTGFVDSEYNAGWRVWSKHPTDKERKSIPWKDSID